MNTLQSIYHKWWFVCLHIVFNGVKTPVDVLATGCLNIEECTKAYKEGA